MLDISKFQKRIAGRTKWPRGPHVTHGRCVRDPCCNHM